MPTEKQRKASRANGARSRGPATAAGKARSALNALKHGLFAETVLLPGEPAGELAALGAEYLATFDPVNVAELAAVNDLIAAAWRLRRARRIEQAEFELALEELAPEIEEQHPGATPDQRLALAYRYLTERGAIRSVERQEARLARLYDRAAARLDRLRAEREAAAAPGAPVEEPAGENEPEEEASSDSRDRYGPDDQGFTEQLEDLRRMLQRARSGRRPQDSAADRVRAGIDETLSRLGGRYAPDEEPEDELDEE